MYILWWGSNPEIDGFTTASLERSKWVGETDCRPKDCNDSTNNRENSTCCVTTDTVAKWTSKHWYLKSVDISIINMSYWYIEHPYLANLGDGSIGIVLNPVCYSTLWSPISQSEEKELQIDSWNWLTVAVIDYWQLQILGDNHPAQSNLTVETDHSNPSLNVFFQ